MRLKLLLLLFGLSLHLYGIGQQIKMPRTYSFETKVSNETNEIICYAGEHSHHLRIGAPRELLLAAGRTQATSTFEVTYVGFDEFPEAEAAFQAAVEIWEGLIQSDVPIQVTAVFATDLEENTLGSAITGGYVTFPANAATPKFNTIYPVALAEKLARQPLNDPASGIDILAQFNANRDDWYFGIDANPASDQFDFLTVVLHELGHGLGFNGASQLDNSRGTLGLEGTPFAFTTNIELGETGEYIIESIENGSVEMGEALESNDLFFKTEYFNGDTRGKVKLYAPTSYVQGQSIFHLDESYSVGADALMTPFIDRDEVVHNPGISLPMLNDLGWIFTWIDHEPLVNNENFTDNFEILATISGDNPLDEDSVFLNYGYINIYDTTDNGAFRLKMAATANANEYAATITPPSNTEAIYFYHIEAWDQSGRKYTNPGEPELFEFNFFSAEDVFVPEIVHQEIVFALEGEDTIAVDAVITDFLMGIDTAYVEYEVNGVSQPSFGLAFDEQDPDSFSGDMLFGTEGLSTGDVVNYSITAIDRSVAQNLARSPATGTFTFTVEAEPDPVSEYVTDFESGGSDFISSTFSVRNETGFTGNALHSPHPYDEAVELGASSVNYTAVLKYPIIIKDQNPFMEFEEVALVEPGNPGTEFGDGTFWDYVIVEGSKDQGKTWAALLDGYDSRAHTQWENSWNNGIQPGGNSSTTANSSLLKARTIDLTASGAFSSGDTIRIRFRLFSDELAAGWGWVIDDLNIQSGITGIEELIGEAGDLKIYPNPVMDDRLRVEARLRKPVSDAGITVYNSLGVALRMEEVRVTRSVLEHDIDLSGFPAGIYLLNLQLGSETISRRIVKQ